MRLRWYQEVLPRQVSAVAVLCIVICLISLVGSAAAFEIGPTTPGKWGAPAFGTPGGEVTWSLTPTGTNCSARFLGCTFTALEDFMPSGFSNLIEAAFDAWATVTDITFLKVTDNGVPFNDPIASGDIRIGGHGYDSDGSGGVLASAYFPPFNGSTAAGDIHFDVAETWKLADGGPGFNIFRVSLHEIGHALGLAHEDVGDAVAVLNPFYTESTALGLLSDDVAGAQFIYGPAVVTNPEPGTMLLLSTGLIGLLGYGWWRRT